MIEFKHQIPTRLMRTLRFKKEEFLMKNSSLDQKKKRRVIRVIHLKHEVVVNKSISILQFKTTLLKKLQNFLKLNNPHHIKMMGQTCNQTLMTLISKMTKMMWSDLPMFTRLIYLDLKESKHFEEWTWALKEESFAQFLELLVVVRQQC